jgi:hypothetical protein
MSRIEHSATQRLAIPCPQPYSLPESPYAVGLGQHLGQGQQPREHVHQRQGGNRREAPDVPCGVLEAALRRSRRWLLRVARSEGGARTSVDSPARWEPAALRGVL